MGETIHQFDELTGAQVDEAHDELGLWDNDAATTKRIPVDEFAIAHGHDTIDAHMADTTNPHDVVADQVVPDQTGNNGKYLTTDGLTVSWGDPTAGVPPSGTGFRHITGGVEDGAAKLVTNSDVAALASIVETKLSLNYATHSTANDPTTDQKAALAGTSGVPSGANKYVTNADSRNTDARTPTAHGSANHTGTIGTPTQVGLGNVPNVNATNATNITSGTLDGDRLPALSQTKKGGVPATGVPSGKFLKDDNTWATPAGAGDMAKATYDTDDDGIVDKAESVDDGAGNAKTALEIKTAIDTTLAGKADLVPGAVEDNFCSWDAAGQPQDSGNKAADFAAADAVLTRAAGDFATFTEKASPVDADLVLIEDSAAAGAKKKVQLANLPGGSGLPDQTGHDGQFLSTDGATADWAALPEDSRYLLKTLGSAQGSLISFSAASTPAELTAGTNGQILSRNSGTATGLEWIASTAGSDWYGITTKPFITVGDTGYGSSIDDLSGALTAIGSTSCTLMVTKGASCAGDDTVISCPANVHLVVERGGMITVASGKTFTINGPFEAGRYQVFNVNSGCTYAQGVKFAVATIAECYPEWWGAKSCAFDDDTQATANTVGITRALNCRTAGTYRIPVKFMAGEFYINGELHPSYALPTIIGVSSSSDWSTTKGTAIIDNSNHPAEPLLNLGDANGTGAYIQNMMFMGIYNSTKLIDVTSSLAAGVRIDNVLLFGGDTWSTGVTPKIRLDLGGGSGGKMSIITNIGGGGTGSGIRDGMDTIAIENVQLTGSNLQGTGIELTTSSNLHNVVVFGFDKGIHVTGTMPRISNIRSDQNRYNLYVNAFCGILGTNVRLTEGYVSSLYSAGAAHILLSQCQFSSYYPKDTVPQVTVDASKTFTIASKWAVGDTYLGVGDTFKIMGAINPGNNGNFKITSVDATGLIATCSAAADLVNETTSGATIYQQMRYAIRLGDSDMGRISHCDFWEHSNSDPNHTKNEVFYNIATDYNKRVCTQFENNAGLNHHCNIDTVYKSPEKYYAASGISGSYLRKKPGLTATPGAGNTFTVTGNSTGYFTNGRTVTLYCGTDGIQEKTVDSSSYSAPNTTVTLTASFSANLESVHAAGDIYQDFIIMRPAGSWVTLGVEVGDYIRVSTGEDNLYFHSVVREVTASKLVCHGDPLITLNPDYAVTTTLAIEKIIPPWAKQEIKASGTGYEVGHLPLLAEGGKRIIKVTGPDFTLKQFTPARFAYYKAGASVTAITGSYNPFQATPAAGDAAVLFCTDSHICAAKFVVGTATTGTTYKWRYRKLSGWTDLVVDQEVFNPNVFDSIGTNTVYFRIPLDAITLKPLDGDYSGTDRKTYFLVDCVYVSGDGDQGEVTAIPTVSMLDLNGDWPGTTLNAGQTDLIELIGESGVWREVGRQVT